MKIEQYKKNKQGGIIFYTKKKNKSIYLIKNTIRSDNVTLLDAVYLYLMSSSCIILRAIIYIHLFFILNLILTHNFAQYVIMMYISDTYWVSLK